MDNSNEQPKYPHTEEDEAFNKLMEERERAELGEAAPEASAEVPKELAETALLPEVTTEAVQDQPERELEHQ